MERFHCDRLCVLSLRRSVSSAVNASAADPGAVGDVPRQPAAHRQHRRPARPREARGAVGGEVAGPLRRSPVPVKDGMLPLGHRRVQPADDLASSRSPRRTPPQPTWTKSAPYLKLASVSSPAVAGDYLVFGDGMHQDSGGVLHCVTPTTGKPLWQLTLPGDLIHLEGAPRRRGRQGLHRRRRGRRAVRRTGEGHARRQGLRPRRPSRRCRTRSGRNSWRSTRRRRKKDDFAIPPDDSQLLKFAPKKRVAEGRGEVARRRAGERRRRQGARADLVPRQGEGRRAGALLPERRDRRDRVEDAS